MRKKKPKSSSDGRTLKQGQGDVHGAAERLGEKGGDKGGPARAKKLSGKERSDIARQGGKAKAKKEGGK